MPPQVARLNGVVQNALRGFTAGQKAVIAVVLAAMLLGGYVFSSWASSPSMVPLFTSLEPTDAAAVTEELNGKGVDYALEDGGRTVMVPKADVYQLRLDLSAAGLPSAGKSGYALLDDQGMTTSEFRQHVDYQRALEGELTKTIGSLQGVRAATVHLVMPEEELFSDEARQPSASVLLSTRPGTTLSAGQVQAVVHLVSSSVEGLEPTAVTVADDTGTVLNAPGEDGQSSAAGDARTAQTTVFENGLSTSVEEMLTQLVGPGNAVVRVKADLDFDKREITTESFADGVAPKTSETTETEAYTGGAGPIVGGVLGPDNAPAAAVTGEGSDYDKKATSTSWAVGRTTELAKTAPGAVKRLSVAVVLDAEASGNLQPDEVKQVVAAAVGLDTTRGDVVEVRRMTFDDSAQEAARAELEQAEAAAGRDQVIGYAKTGGLVLLVLVVVLIAARSLRRDRRTPVLLTTAELETVGLVEDEHVLAMAGAPRQLEQAVDARELQRLQVREEIGDLVERQPDEVAQLLRGWLADRRS